MALPILNWPMQSYLIKTYTGLLLYLIEGLRTKTASQTPVKGFAASVALTH
jgi:hypothetical protein